VVKAFEFAFIATSYELFFFGLKNLFSL